MNGTISELVSQNDIYSRLWQKVFLEIAAASIKVHPVYRPAYSKAQNIFSLTRVSWHLPPLIRDQSTIDEYLRFEQGAQFPSERKSSVVELVDLEATKFGICVLASLGHNADIRLIPRSITE